MLIKLTYHWDLEIQLLWQRLNDQPRVLNGWLHAFSSTELGALALATCGFDKCFLFVFDIFGRSVPLLHVEVAQNRLVVGSYRRGCNTSTEDPSSQHRNWSRGDV